MSCPESNVECLENALDERETSAGFGAAYILWALPYNGYPLHESIIESRVTQLLTQEAHPEMRGTA